MRTYDDETDKRLSSTRVRESIYSYSCLVYANPVRGERERKTGFLPFSPVESLDNESASTLTFFPPSLSGIMQKPLVIEISKIYCAALFPRFSILRKTEPPSVKSGHYGGQNRRIWGFFFLFLAKGV